MSKIQNRLNSLQPYVIGVRFQNGISIVDAVFKNGWSVPKSEVIESEKGEGDDLNYHMFFTQEEDLGLDEILDYVEKIIGLNIEREKKHALLKAKAKELTDIFRKNPLSKLQGMRFVLGSEPLVQEMEPDPLDVVDFPLESLDTPQPTPQPQPVAKPQPQPQQVVQEPVPQPQTVAQEPVVDEANVRRAPNGEIIPPLTPIDNGDIDESEFKKFDLTAKEETITKDVGNTRIDLPKKSRTPKVELDIIEGPGNVVCQCTEPDQVCPACEEEKIGSY